MHACDTPSEIDGNAGVGQGSGVRCGDARTPTTESSQKLSVNFYDRKIPLGLFSSNISERTGQGQMHTDDTFA